MADVRKSLFLLVTLCGACFPAFGAPSRVDPQWPSFVFFGAGENQEIDSSRYFRGQEGKPPPEPMTSIGSGKGAIGSGTAQPVPVSSNAVGARTMVKPYFSSGRR